MFPHENPIAVPEIIKTPEFQLLFKNIKAQVVNYFAENAPSDATAIAETLENNAELLTKFTQAITTIIQAQFRQMNAQAQQMFGMYATDDAMIDLIVSQLNIKRQVIEKGDLNAFPKVLPKMETNHDLLTRYYLAAYALASTGTRGGYRFHAMTLGGRPSLTVDSSQANKVIVTYDFEENSFSGKTKDAQARQIKPGEVDCYILSHIGNGLPSDELVNATQVYLSKDEIAQETDLITVKKAVIKNWNLAADLYINSGVDADLVKASVTKAVQDYGNLNHKLLGNIEPSMLYKELLKATGAYRADLIEPVDAIRCLYSEAPYLEQITINIITQNFERII